ncbi:MAG: zinc ribbon domain-containing protein [Deltaproteobacteria bacterium]|nr:zinc ribbon domain-containing protein [Deltaproteobacteria bacterium]
MPIYEYSCRDCGSRFEKLQKSGSGTNPRVRPAVRRRQLKCSRPSLRWTRPHRVPDVTRVAEECPPDTGPVSK